MAVDRWVDEVATAAAELRSASRTTAVAMIGMRLGATLAALACRRGLEAERLVLWDAVLSGSAYLSELMEMQQTMISARHEDPPGPDEVGNELLGSPYPNHLRVSLGEISLGTANWPDTPTVLIDSRPGRESLDPHPLISHIVVDDPARWDDYAALQAALLPKAIPAVIEQRLEDLP